MAKIIRLNDGGAWYSHALTHPDENERDYIFGGDGDDVIFGDDENWGDYGPSWAWYEYNFHTYIIDYHAPVSHRPLREQYEDTDDTSSTLIALLSPNGAKDSRLDVDIDEFIGGGDGNDFLAGGGGNDWLYGGNDNDFLAGGTGNDFLEGGDGNDILAAGTGAFDVILGGRGDDIVSFTSAYHGSFADGGSDTDTLKLDPSSDSFAFDLVTGGSERTSGIRFEAIHFELLEYIGGDGIDGAWGGALEDKLRGNGGDDILDGRGGKDDLEGGDGNDTLFGGDGDDYISGGNDVDTIEDGIGDDTVYGGDGDDIINTGEGNDTIHGGTGKDKIKEIGADDVLNLFRNANDRIFGEDGDDEIYGGTGKDVIFGGDDNDTISGGSGIDELTGGDGKDTFLFQFGDFEIVNGNPLMGIDRIKDFQPDLDKVDLSDFAAHAIGGKLFLDDNDGTPGEAGEVMFTPRGSNNEHTQLSLDLEGDGKYDLRVLFEGLAFNPAHDFSVQNVLLVDV